MDTNDEINELARFGLASLLMIILGIILVEGKDVPQILVVSVSMIIGFYFGQRNSNNNGNNQSPE